MGAGCDRCMDRQTEKYINRCSDTETKPTADLHVITSGQTLSTEIHNQTLRPTNAANDPAQSSGQTNTQRDT